MGDFGYKTKGPSNINMADYILGTPYTCPEAGTATSISAYVAKGAGQGVGSKFKYAIYKVSDDSRVGYTEEYTCAAPAIDTWITLNIANGGSLTAQDYYLVWWADTNLQSFWYAADIDGCYDSETYNGFPSPFNPSVYASHKFSIYCTYEAEAPPAGQPYISRVQRVTGMRSWGGISSFYKRFPTFKPRKVA